MRVITLGSRVIKKKKEGQTKLERRVEEIQVHLPQGSRLRVQDSGFRVQGPGFRVQGSGFRVQG